jgi:hypothetical protein
MVFSAIWCGRCKNAEPTIKWLEQYVKVNRYDFYRDKQVFARFNITSVPTFILGELRTHDVKKVIKALGLEADFAAAFASALTTGSMTSCSRWAANRRIMGGDFSGPYSFKHHPWCKTLHDTRASFNWVMKAAQMGLTEVAVNRSFYVLDQLKRDVLYVLPTRTAASKFSKGRFTTALALSPYIKSIFTSLNAVDLKQAGESTLYISGSKGNSNLKNIPVSELVLDELEEMDQSAIWLALERLSGQQRKCTWGLSTPTVPLHGIHKFYKDSTQEHFMFKCPGCSRRTELVWPDCVEIVGEHATDAKCQESFLKCKECGAKLEHKAKPEWLANGYWQATAPNANPDVRGFYINQLYSSTVNPGELVSSYFRGFGDEWAASEFYNSKLGLPFVAEGAQVTDEMLDNAIAGHTMQDVRPERGGRWITMGVDQGDPICHAVVCEWLLDGDAEKDIQAATICKVLWAGLFPSADFSRLDQLMAEWQVLQCVVDADPQINEMRRFARRYPGYVMLSRYRRVKQAKEIVISDEDTGAPMATVDRTHWLGGALGRFKPNPPRIRLPRDIPNDFLLQMKNLVRHYKKLDTGELVAVYTDIGPDHYAHALTYASIALERAPMLMNTSIRSKVL